MLEAILVGRENGW